MLRQTCASVHQVPPFAVIYLPSNYNFQRGGKNEPTPLFQLDIPAKLQVGAHSAAVYTTKIMLAQARVSKRPSQPFKVRVEINIAGSRAGGVE